MTTVAESSCRFAFEASFLPQDPPPPSPSPYPPRWSVERRLDFIASRLAWEGRINRQDLVARFGVSPNQATADLKRFEALNPGALVYDPRAKTYRAGEGLTPLGLDAARDLLRELRLIAEGVMPGDGGVLAFPPPVDPAEPAARPVVATVLRAVVAAVRENRALGAVYQSFSSPAPRRRRLEPHALVFDGFRWHVRARDQDDGAFKDFVLGRLTEAEDAGAAMGSGGGDAAWHTFVTLEVRPHPGLSASQRSAIARRTSAAETPSGIVMEKASGSRENHRGCSFARIDIG